MVLASFERNFVKAVAVQRRTLSPHILALGTAGS
jgi:hypothetical protein